MEKRTRKPRSVTMNPTTGLANHACAWIDSLRCCHLLAWSRYKTSSMNINVTTWNWLYFVKWKYWESTWKLFRFYTSSLSTMYSESVKNMSGSNFMSLVSLIKNKIFKDIHISLWKETHNNIWKRVQKAPSDFDV